MYGVPGFDNEEDLQKLLGLNLPEAIQQENYHTQDTPEIAHGLLGGIGEKNNTPKLSGNTANIAAQLGQTAQAMAQGGGGADDVSKQQHAQGLQALAQQQAQQQQLQQTAMRLLVKYFTGGFG